MSERGFSSEVSRSGDIYSYGILVLEMITGKRSTDSMFEGGLNLHNFVRIALPCRVKEIVDPMILDEAREVKVVGNQGHPQEKNWNRTGEYLVSTLKIDWRAC